MRYAASIFLVLNSDELTGCTRNVLPIFVVMRPPCAGLGGFSRLNRAINHEGWCDSRENSLPLAELAGQTAIYQYEYNRHWLGAIGKK